MKQALQGETGFSSNCSRKEVKETFKIGVGDIRDLQREMGKLRHWTEKGNGNVQSGIGIKGAEDGG